VTGTLAGLSCRKGRQGWFFAPFLLLVDLSLARQGVGTTPRTTDDHSQPCRGRGGMYLLSYKYLKLVASNFQQIVAVG